MYFPRNSLPLPIGYLYSLCPPSHSFVILDFSVLSSPKVPLEKCPVVAELEPAIMTTGLFCLLKASSRSVDDKWRINLLLPSHAKNSTKNRFKQSLGICERLEERAVNCTGSQTPAEGLVTASQSSLHSGRSFHPPSNLLRTCGAGGIPQRILF